MPANVFEGRKMIVAAADTPLGGALQAGLEGLGADVVAISFDGKAGPIADDLREEDRVTPWLDQCAQAAQGADALIYAGVGWSGGVLPTVETSIAGGLFCLKLAKRLQPETPFDVLFLAGAFGEGIEQVRAADMWEGASRQMMKTAASETGPLTPPMTANQVVVTGGGTAEALSPVLARLLARPQGYISGTTISVAG